jgi:succinate dehydrogenase/fumarate reductase flavoprotein subunit
MYPGLTPPLIGNDQYPITLSGDGRSMAYRAGAELMDVEMFGRHIGLRYFARSGQATWIGVYRDAKGKPLGPYVDKPNRTYGDILPEVDKEFVGRKFAAGEGPIYFDCTGISDDDYEYMKHWLINEGNEAVLNYFEENGIDPRKNPLEFMTYPIEVSARIWSNEKTETSVKGLYSAGDETTFSMSGASVFGWIAGENATNYAKSCEFGNLDNSANQIEGIKQLTSNIESRQQGPDWRDANFALQQIMADYAGLVRSKLMLEAGLKHLKELKTKIINTGVAKTHWELIRYMEVLNLYDLGELIMLAALERKETRGLHRRMDYQITDPLLHGKILYVKKGDTQPIFTWREKQK